MNSELTKTRKLNKLLPVRTNAVGHWRFRGDLTDASPQGNDLTDVDAGTYTGYGWSEKITTAINPTGPAGPAAKIVAGSATDFDFGTGDFTIEAVIATLESGAQYLMVKEDGGGTTTGFLFVIVGGKVSFKIGDGSNDDFKPFALSINDGAWHHVAITVDRTNGELRGYVDGVLDVNFPYDISAITGSVSAASNDLEIGKTFDGSIDELVVTPQVLTAGEIANRAAGVLEPYVPVVDGELLGYLPTMHHGNADLDELLIPFENLFAALRGKAFDVSDLIKFDQVPERHLPALAALFNFELPEDSTVLDLDARREMFRWITWLYQRKGTYACADKLIELAGLTAATLNKYPSSVPFTLNVHRTFGYGRAEQITFTEDFSGNMSQWDPPLNSSLPWRLQNGALYCKVGSDTNPNNAILFDDSERSFYMEADVKMIDAYDYFFGFYLAYADSNNWLRISKEPHTGGSTKWLLRWSDGGSGGSTVLSDAWGTWWNDYNDGDTIKIWVHADLDSKTYSAGIDGKTIIFNVTYVHPDIVGTKKGVWQGFNAEVEWDNVVVKNLRPELAATLPGDDYQDRTMKITYSGTSDASQKRKAYVAAVLPRYIPFGVILDWIREIPVSSRIGFRTGSFTITKGWRMAGDKGARIGFRTGTPTIIKGSLVRTPTPCRIGFRTRIVGVVRTPAATRIGFRTTAPTIIKRFTLIAAEFDESHSNPLYWPDQNTSFWNSYHDVLIDGSLSAPGRTGSPTYNSVYCVAYNGTAAVTKVYLYDTYATEPDGLNSGSANKVALYRNVSGYVWSLVEEVSSPTRTGNITTVTLATPYSFEAGVVKLYMYDETLKSPDGTALEITEIALEAQ